MNKTTHVLYGVADRDVDEPVCMFFDTWDEMWAFVHDLPGRYRTMKLFGVIPEDFVAHADMPLTSSRAGA